MTRTQSDLLGSEDSKVAIVGLGIVSALGNSVADALENAIAGKTGIRPYRADWSEEVPDAVERVGGVVEGFDATKFIEAKLAARYDPTVNFALGAAHEAMTDASLAPEDAERTGVLLGTGMAGAELWHRVLHGVYAEKRSDAISGSTSVALGPSCPSAIISLRHKLRGPSMAVATYCASGATAIGMAADQIRLGRADRMLAGGTEASMRSLVAYASFAAAGGMNVTRAVEGAVKPFGVGRKGFVLGEGAAILVLERLSSARRRGAKIYGLLLGEGHANDAYHFLNPEPSGERWASTIEKALEAAGVGAECIDAISAHAPGTEQGDLTETRAIKRVFGERAKRIPISATKALHGHSFAAVGAIETVLAVGAMHRGFVLPTINCQPSDAECDLDYVPNQGRKVPVKYLLKNSFGAGGSACALIIRNWRD